MFNELMESAMAQDNGWRDMLLNAWGLPEGLEEFIFGINSGVNGVFDVIGMCFAFFLDVPALSLLLFFGTAFGSVQLLRRAFSVPHI